MAQYRHKASGVTVEVRDDKVMDPTQWEVAKAPAEKKPATRKAPAKKSD